jgi:phosphate transport system substrate-binding protein
MAGLLAVIGLLGACSAAPAASIAEPISCASGEVAGLGSSAQANAVSVWIRTYQASCAEATVSYSSIGSGAGVTAFAGGTGDFAGSDSPVSTADQPEVAARCKGAAIHLPMVVGPIALTYNVAGVSSLRLQPDTIARIFDGRVAAWNDPAIKRDNPEVALPATPIKSVHRSDSSGTTDNFTKFLAGTAGPDWSEGSGSTWKAPGGIAGKGSNQVVATIERTDGAIGYVEASYARFHNLPTAAVGTGAGSFTTLTDEAAGRMIGSARITGSGGDLRLSIDYRSGSAEAYPIVLVTYEIVCKTGTPALVKSFLTYASSPAGQDAAARLGYAPLPEDLRAKVSRAVAAL